MLYIYYGTDQKKVADKARVLVDSLRSKKPDASFVEINSDNWTPSIIDEHVGGQGLFSNKYIVYINRVCNNEEKLENILEKLDLMKESTNIFIVSEGKINAECKKKFDKYGDKVVVYDESEEIVKKEFNIFALADAIGNRDSMKAWAIYRQALDNDLEPESILGTIFWQIKSMAVAGGAKTAGEAGLNPFVYSKARKGYSLYGEERLSELLKKVIVLYHDGHRGLVDLELGIEKLVLSI